MSEKNTVIVIAGQTASGKTSCAVSIAYHLQGTVVSADSRQVYRGLDIGTGKDLDEYHCHPSPVPYELIDIVDPTRIYTLYEYQRDCYEILRKLYAKNTQPVMCGGSGLYIEAVLSGYTIPNVPEDPDLRRKLAEFSKENLRNRLQTHYPHLIPQTDTSSKKRIIRALEIGIFSHNRSVLYGTDNYLPLRPVIIVPFWEKAELISRIEKRIDDRLAEGMVNEVASLLNETVSRDRMNLFGLEYRIITEYILKKTTWKTMREQLSVGIRRYAKRQKTWFRGMERRGFTIQWIRGNDVDEAMKYISKNL
ncbi:MAG: tRNA (adenosine(37)-N6)-dimethylallyltransferase MiaA [Fibrobacterota bacterium]